MIGFDRKRTVLLNRAGHTVASDVYEASTSWREIWERNFGRDWRQDVAEHSLEKLTDEFEEAVDRVQDRLVRIWGPQILEESDEG